jgi:hypothetical protein
MAARWDRRAAPQRGAYGCDAEPAHDGQAGVVLGAEPARAAASMASRTTVMTCLNRLRSSELGSVRFGNPVDRPPHGLGEDPADLLVHTKRETEGNQYSHFYLACGLIRKPPVIAVEQTHQPQGDGASRAAHGHRTEVDPSSPFLCTRIGRHGAQWACLGWSADVSPSKPQ